MKITKQTVVAAVAAATLVALAGAVSVTWLLSTQTRSGLSVSRATIYDSLDELVADSSMAIVGRVVGVQGRTIPAGGGPVNTTIAEVRIVRSVSLAGRDVTMPAAGNTVKIEQLGTPESSSEISYLQPDVTYLLFIGDPLGGRHLHITGLWAGIYTESGDGTFTRLRMDDDTLPTTLRLTDLA